jgi:hypothetical protein
MNDTPKPGDAGHVNLSIPAANTIKKKRRQKPMDAAVSAFMAAEGGQRDKIHAAVLAYGKAADEAHRARMSRATRPERWSDAASKAVAALSDLCEVQQEYQDWYDALNDSAQSSPMGEKLDAIINLDLNGAKDTAEEAESAELPMGFGKD